MVHRGPELGVHAITKGLLEGRLPLVLTLQACERAAAGVEELGEGLDGRVAAEVEAADEEGKVCGFSVRDRSEYVSVSSSSASLGLSLSISALICAVSLSELLGGANATRTRSS